MVKRNVGKRAYVKRGVLEHESKKYHYQVASGKSIFYRCVIRNCPGRAVKNPESGDIKVKVDHHCVTTSLE